MFSIIACIGKNRELGKNNQLIFRLKEDMKFFREKTIGHKILMGRKTFESLNGKLKNREHLVVSNHKVENADLLIPDLKDFINKHKDTPENIFVIGGGMIYSELLPYAKNLYLTEVNAIGPEADTFFPNFDKSKYTKTVIKKGAENGVAYLISQYIKK